MTDPTPPAGHRSHDPHEIENLCAAGTQTYARALRAGRITRQDAAPAPCLLDFGLLRPDPGDPGRLLPAAPAVVLPQLMRAIEDDIARHRRREATLAELFEPFMELGTPDAAAADGPDGSGTTVLHGLRTINHAIGEAMAHAVGELLTVQPGGARPSGALAAARPREQAMLGRGARMRTLYQHTARHSAPVVAHYEQLRGDVEVRTLSEVTERLVVIDRAVAFIPAAKDRTVALRVHHPALVGYFVTTFERLWRLATPMWPTPARRATPHGVPARQYEIAELLVEGHTDAEIALRLAMNVRTVRVHIAKLASTLGSDSRAQLGYLIGRSGLLEPGVGSSPRP
ncbi:LuxR C-terminal-related transcriptional regulator [Streptomyces uncialis]|uniref:helix-turn-helix transcriptional regulator n=1 Tax=Streptomyces uncialis TaxID=1048205 RepID=UPI00380DF0EA